MTVTWIVVGVIGLLVGVVARLLLPRPRVGSCLLVALAGVVGGELGVLIGGQASTSLAWVLGLVLLALFVGVAIALAAWRAGPYPPHDTAPRSVDPDERVRGGRHEAGRVAEPGEPEEGGGAYSIGGTPRADEETAGVVVSRAALRRRRARPGNLPVSEILSTNSGASSPFGHDLELPMPAESVGYQLPAAEEHTEKTEAY